MSAPQTMLARFALATSIVALLGVAVVATRDSAGGGSDESSAGLPVPVALSEFVISPTTITAPKGGSLAVTNNGSQLHNVAVTGTALKLQDLPAGGSGTLDVSSLDPGEYEIFCSVPGHKDSGMTGTLVISDGTPKTAANAAVDTEAAASSSGGEHEGHDAADIGSLEATDPMAKRINKEMEQAMSGGVRDFLAYADRYATGDIKTGNNKIKPKVLSDGTKRFTLTAGITDWEVSPGKVVKAWTYNKAVPGPWIRVEPGDKVEVKLRNELPVSTDIHWHGIDVPNDQDGLAPITQDFIRPYETYTYAFTVPNHPQLGMYHAHMHGQEAIVNGLFAVFQVGDVALPRGETFDNMQVPADLEIDQEIPMVLNDAGVIGLSLNGKAFPATQPLAAEVGDWILIHFYNEGLQGHPMHLHRQPQLVVAKDGFPLKSPYRADTVWIAPGERYSVLVEVEDPGIWAFHCHIVSHAESDAGLFGMVTALVVPDPKAA